MDTNQTEPGQSAGRLLSCLRGLKGDRGAMADLRCALSEARRPRAWPHLARAGGIGDPRMETIAGLYGYHPVEAEGGNLGQTCRRLKQENESFEARFLRLLACGREEICERVRPVVLAARAKGIAVNYEQLYLDLVYWGGRVRERWAMEYWAAGRVE